MNVFLAEISTEHTFCYIYSYIEDFHKTTEEKKTERDENDCRKMNGAFWLCSCV